MRLAIVVWTTFFLLAPTCGAKVIPSASISFGTPSELEGDLELSANDGSWLVFFFQSATAEFSLDSASSFRVSNNTFSAIHGEMAPLVSRSEIQTVNVSSEQRSAGRHLEASFAGSHGMLVVGANNIELSARGVDGVLSVLRPQDLLSWPSSETRHQNPYWAEGLDIAQSEVVIALAPTLYQTPFVMAAQGIHTVRWFSAEINCRAEQCPDGGGRYVEEIPAPGPHVGMTHYSYGHAISSDANISAAGFSSQIIFFGERPDVSVSGLLRLPHAKSDLACSNCRSPTNQSVRLAGITNLEELHAASSGILEANVSGEWQSAAFDEVAIVPSEILGGTLVASAATASALVLLKFLLAPLFTRLSKEQALEHPRRKQIFEYIQQHPGANFREVARSTGIAAGTVRHHLNVLERSGQVVEHNHGSTVRLFENHGKFDQNWSDLVLLREPALGKLHEWLKAHPNSAQKTVLEAMEKEAWSRSTTQHRLSRLVDGGVASIRLQGRLKLYSVIERPAARAPGLPAAPRALPA